jgi:hypothetical protein
VALEERPGFDRQVGSGHRSCRQAGDQGGGDEGADEPRADVSREAIPERGAERGMRHLVSWSGR